MVQHTVLHAFLAGKVPHVDIGDTLSNHFVPTILLILNILFLHMLRLQHLYFLQLLKNQIYSILQLLTAWRFAVF